MKRAAILICLVGTTVALSACGATNRLSTRQEFNGVYFRPRLDVSRDDRASFTVSVNDASRTIDGAREAARHKAVEHCIKQFGLSDIDWTVGPDAETLPVVDDTLTLSGECRGWL